jgi:hypothetical protein
MSNKSKITVGIPTRYAGNSLLKTVQSIYASTGVKNIRCIIVADSEPLTSDLKQKLEKLGAEVYWNPTPGSQFKKLKQCVDKATSEIFIFTQDDITFRHNTIAEIIKTFELNPEVTMVATRILPLSPLTLFEKSMTSMVRIIDNIASRWNNGSNYLAASGRCLSFKTKTVKQFNLREKIVNGDMYLYLENKRLNGKFARSEKSIVYIRCPQSLKDQIGPSSRYQFSATEMTKYFSFNIQQEYIIPFNTFVISTILEFISHPVSAFLYTMVFGYTRLKRQPFHSINPIWKIDESTKK